MGVAKGDPRSLDNNPYNSLYNPSFSFIFHFFFHLIRHYGVISLYIPIYPFKGT